MLSLIASNFDSSSHVFTLKFIGVQNSSQTSTLDHHNNGFVSSKPTRHDIHYQQTDGKVGLL
jgi:hypothetical protein